MKLLVLMASVALGTLLSACGSGAGSDLDVEPAIFTEAGEACVDFYRSAQESVEEEAVCMREFADRIAALGHDDAAVVLSDLADQWEVGTWEAGQDEVWQSALWAEAGELLGAAGAVRCADLAEWWGIHGYEGEPNPEEMLQRQASIWVANDLDDYYLLVAAGHDGGDLTQAHIRIQGGEVTSVSEIDPGSVAVDELPHSVDQIYSILLDGNAADVRYDLVWSAPRTLQMTDRTHLIVVVDDVQFPKRIVEFDVPDYEGVSG